VAKQQEVSRCSFLNYRLDPKFIVVGGYMLPDFYETAMLNAALEKCDKTRSKSEIIKKFRETLNGVRRYYKNGGEPPPHPDDANIALVSI